MRCVHTAFLKKSDVNIHCSEILSVVQVLRKQRTQKDKKTAKVQFSHTRYPVLGQELILV